MNIIVEKMTNEYIDDLLVRAAHHSTAIEGNTLTLGDTISILIHNYIPKGMTEREYYEVKNYKKAFELLLKADRVISTISSKKSPISISGSGSPSENIKEFVKWGIELENKERERIELFHNKERG